MFIHVRRENCSKCTVFYVLFSILSDVCACALSSRTLPPVYVNVVLNEPALLPLGGPTGKRKKVYIHIFYFYFFICERKIIKYL